MTWWMFSCSWRASKLAPVCEPKPLFVRLALTPGGRACGSRDVDQCYNAVKREVQIARVQLCQSAHPLCHEVPPLASWLLAACAGPLGKFAVLLGDEYRVTARFLERDGPCLRCSGIRDRVMKPLVNRVGVRSGGA